MLIATEPPKLFSFFLILASLVFFALVSLWKLYLPGLYYDEVLFVPPAARLFDSCSLPAGVYYQLGCIPVILQPPNLGALKALIYAAVFEIFPVGAASVRLPAIIIFAAALWLYCAFWRQRLTGWLGLALTALVFTDVVAISHARVDWGPYVLAAAFKMLALCLALKWIESGKPWHLVGLVLAIMAGIFDKLNFLWVAGALAVAMPAVYWREMLKNLRQLEARHVLVLAGLTAGSLAWLVFGIIPVIRGSSSDQSIDLMRQAAHVLALIKATLDSGPYEFFFAEPWPGLHLHAGVMFASLFCGLCAAVFLPLIRRRLGRDGEAARLAAYSAFATLVLLCLIAAMIATKEVGGSHHIVVITQVWQLQLICLIGTALCFVPLGAAQALRAGLNYAAGGVATALLLANVQAGRIWIGALAEHKPSNPNFSAQIYRLADTLNAQPNVPVVTVDWGLGNTLFALAPSGQRQRIHDMWPSFLGKHAQKDLQGILMAVIGNAPEALFVMHGDKTTTFPEALQAFKELVPAKPECQSTWQNFTDFSGTVEYVVAKLPSQCFAALSVP